MRHAAWSMVVGWLVLGCNAEPTGSSESTFDPTTGVTGTSGSSTSNFVQMVHDAKAECGDVCVVTTGAIAGQCYDQPGNINTRLYDFMNGFGQPPASWINLEWGMVPDFGTVLGDALADAIATTCDEIQPEG